MSRHSNEAKILGVQAFSPVKPNYTNLITVKMYKYKDYTIQTVDSPCAEGTAGEVEGG